MRYEDLDEKQKAWVDKQVNAPFKVWFDEFMNLKQRIKIATSDESANKLSRLVGLIAKRRLEANNMMRLEVGSAWSWIDKTWFEQAKAEKVIVYINPIPDTDALGNRVEGTWVPAYDEVEHKVEVGKRGTKPIYETQLLKDYSRFMAFENRYLEWKDKNKDTTQMSMEQIKDILQF